MDHPSFKHAHPLARRLMDEDFYYSPIEESGPFGSDDGADTFAGFVNWRSLHPQGNPLEYLEQQLQEWDYPPFDLHEQDASRIQHYMHQHEMGLTFLIGMDAAVIAIAFGQLYIEGKVNDDLLNLAKASIDRQLHPELIKLWDESYQPTRHEQLLKMLGVLNQLNP